MIVMAASVTCAFLRSSLSRSRVPRSPARSFPWRNAFCSDSSKVSETEAKDGESTLTVDRSGLYHHGEHTHIPPGKEEMSILSKHLNAIIRFRGGPISVAEYMEEVLTNPTAGFYMHRDVFGAGGDFVTSPDISQMFGELIGVWSTCLWHQMGRPSQVALIELGPGRGTLMADLIRPGNRRIAVDVSVEKLSGCTRRAHKRVLSMGKLVLMHLMNTRQDPVVPEKHILEFHQNSGLQGTSKFDDFSRALSVHLVECSPALRKLQEETLQCIPCDRVPEQKRSQISGSSVNWYMDLTEVPRGVPTIIIAHEFYDALPVHQFQKTPRGWCEKLVDIGDSPGQPLRFVLSPRPTPASKLYLTKRLSWATQEEKADLEYLEVCPESFRYSGTIAKRISEDGGGALIIDYGDDKIIKDSLQAIRKHKFTHVLEDPGLADLSAHVDFRAIRHAATEAAAGGVTVYGPITQSKFLGMLGINFRLEALLNNASEEQAEALQLGYWRLVGEGPAPWLEDEKESSSQTGMGTQYKALAIVNSNLGIPIGFDSC